MEQWRMLKTKDSRYYDFMSHMVTQVFMAIIFIALFQIVMTEQYALRYPNIHFSAMHPGWADVITND